jgi:3,5-dioxohexanoate:acetyl-CoA acetone transferase
MSQPIIITCAPTGGIHTPTMSPHLPITADEIAAASVEAAEAGAAIIHLHARNPGTGQPDPCPEPFQAFMTSFVAATRNTATAGRSRP